jgi:hypothetical protein
MRCDAQCGRYKVVVEMVRQEHCLDEVVHEDAIGVEPEATMTPEGGMRWGVDRLPELEERC